MVKSYKFHVNGMHCKSCVVLTESELGEIPEVSDVKASLKNLSVDVTGDFGDKTAEHIANDLSEVLKPHGYFLSTERKRHSVNWRDFSTAIPFALIFILLFIILQKIGIVNLVDTSDISYGTAFVIGIIASVSTCMAVVGGLVLSVSSNFIKEGDKIRPQVYFHVGRLVSFFIFGGIVGAVGSLFTLGSTSTFVLGIIVAIVLIVLGINLLDVLPQAKKFQITLPIFIGKRVHRLKSINHTLTPMLLGISTFFLPCGFTQSMQIYSLTTGNFWTGALIMSSFAFGTLPMLAILSFGSIGLKDKTSLGIFLKAAGLVVIFFGILNLINSLVAFGVMSPIFIL